MTTTTPADTTRTAAVTILRAVADLIEARPDIPVPRARIDFYLTGENAPAVMAAIAAALPCQWRASVSRSGSYEWLNLDSDGLSASISRGAQVNISAPAADTCLPAGAKTVTVWQPAAALAGLVGPGALAEVA
jgi:hypothetical protein